MLGPEDADDEDTKAEILEEFGTCGTVLQVCALMVYVGRLRASVVLMLMCRLWPFHGERWEMSATPEVRTGR